MILLFNWEMFNEISYKNFNVRFVFIYFLKCSTMKINL